MARRNLFLIILFFCVLTTQAQLPEISKKWLSTHIDGIYERLDSNEYFQYDYSKILSNQYRFEGDRWATYIGFFGPRNRRIDFHLQAEKSTHSEYVVKGKSRLGTNVRELSGTITLLQAYHVSDLKIMTFEYELDEPGDRDGDGKFIGIGCIAFIIRKGKPDIFWAASGEYRELNNTFVGTWERNNSNVSRECIFSFMPSGLQTRLPFRHHLYKDFDELDECRCFYRLTDKVRQFGWADYEDDKGDKTVWWE